MKFDPTGLIMMNNADCWLVLYLGLLAATQNAPKPPAHHVEKAAAAARAPGGSGGEPAIIIELMLRGLMMDGLPLAAEALPRAIQKAGTKGIEKTIEVRVADGVPYEQVDSVLTAARDTAGVKIRLRRLK